MVRQSLVSVEFACAAVLATVFPARNCEPRETCRCANPEQLQSTNILSVVIVRPVHPITTEAKFMTVEQNYQTNRVSDFGYTSNIISNDFDGQHPHLRSRELPSISLGRCLSIRDRHFCNSRFSTATQGSRPSLPNTITPVGAPGPKTACQ